ncbi:uncharacterized protein LOC144885253 [Branchiostoma floridae x Branchiostoma japonicum]
MDPGTFDKIRNFYPVATCIGAVTALVRAAAAISIPAVTVIISAIVIGGFVYLAMKSSTSKHCETAQQNLRSKEEPLQRATTENERLKTAHRRENERLKNKLMSEKQAKERALSRCRKMKEDTVNLEREIESLKEQIASLSNDTSNSYEMSLDSRGATVTIHNNTDGYAAKGDTDVSRYFHQIKENVTTEWKDLAYQLGFTRPDIDTIDERNRDYKSRCLDMLGEWQKREGEVATVAVLMEALRELGLTSVVDGLKSKYPGSLLSTQCSG